MGVANLQLIVRDPDMKEGIAPIASYFAAKILLKYQAESGPRMVSDEQICKSACLLKQMFSQSWIRMRQMPDSLKRIAPADPRIIADRWGHFFGANSNRDIRRVLAQVPSKWDLDVNEAMVQEAWRQLETRYTKVFSHLLTDV
ncbi:MAG: hypothetical protein ACXW1E_08930 [Halobacteriota archaeon]